MLPSWILFVWSVTVLSIHEEQIWSGDLCLEKRFLWNNVAVPCYCQLCGSLHKNAKKDYKCVLEAYTGQKTSRITTVTFSTDFTSWHTRICIISYVTYIMYVCIASTFILYVHSLFYSISFVCVELQNLTLIAALKIRLPLFWYLGLPIRNATWRRGSKS